MDETIILQELENLAAELSVELRYDTFAGRGGLCRYGGKVRLIVNQALSVPDRIHLLSRELSQLPLGDIFIRPQIRKLLDNHADEFCSDFDN